MSNEKASTVETGILLKYNNQWNPLKWEIDVLVKVQDKVLSIPIDRRQKRFIEKEYPAGSTVELDHKDKWHIKSRDVTSNEFKQAIRDFSDYNWEHAVKKKPVGGTS